MTRSLVVVLITLSANLSAQTRFANFPFAGHSTSPDGRFSLTSQCTAHTCEDRDRKLWLVDHRTRSRKMLLEIERNVRTGWSPVGHTFFLNDNLGCNIAEAYLYFPPQDHRLDLKEIIDSKFPDDRRFENDSHHYVNALYWVNQNSVLVKRFGHFDTAGAAGFTVCYRVSTSGGVARISVSHNEDDSCQPAGH